MEDQHLNSKSLNNSFEEEVIKLKIELAAYQFQLENKDKVIRQTAHENEMLKKEILKVLRKYKAGK